MKHASWMPYFVHILQQLYDLDALSEPSILSWREQREDEGDCPEAQFLKIAEPFLNWLEEAEEEEEDDE